MGNRLGLLSRVGTTFAIVMMIVLRMVPATNVAAAQSTESGVSGNTYTSPSFGYSLEWDGSWTVGDEKVEDTYNLLQLTDEGSIFYIEGYSPAIDDEACLTKYGTDTLVNNDGVEDAEVGDPEEGDFGLEAELTFTYSFEDNNGDPASLDMSAWAACQTVEDGDFNIVITHFGVASLWDDEIDARATLLDTLSLTGTSNGDDDTDTDTPSGDDTPVADDTDTGDSNGSDDGASNGSILAEIDGDGDLPDNVDDIISLFQQSITDIDGYWTREIPILTGGLNYVPADAYVPYSGTIQTGCGSATSFGADGSPGSGPFYCPLDNTVYLDINFVNYQFDQVGDMPFIVSFALAHEIGHHVQNLLGMSKCLQTPCLDPNVLTSLELEYMADCYGGSWAADAELRGRLGSVDLDATIVQFIFILSGDTENADATSHGTGALRTWWFLNGYVEGPAKCYETSQVTKDWAQTGPPNPDPSTKGDVQETPTTDDEPTSTPESGGTDDGDLSQMGDAIDTSEGTVTITRTDTSSEVEGRTPDGQFLIVFVTLERPDDVDGPYGYDAWTLVDADGNSYDIDDRTTDALLATAYDDGIDEELSGGNTYKIALVFDVSTDASGFTLVNESDNVQVQLDE